MKLVVAKKLENRDMIRHKRTKEFGYVLGETKLIPKKGNKKAYLLIPSFFPSLGFIFVTHDEIE